MGIFADSRGQPLGCAGASTGGKIREHENAEIFCSAQARSRARGRDSARRQVNIFACMQFSVACMQSPLGACNFDCVHAISFCMHAILFLHACNSSALGPKT